ncbi:uncharacterized protein HMPREF1541_10566 [Cyphellophora europaea CBS 101466]|uniref:Vacuolar protein sorting/targeting protein 10 n=1 Tax=Cyphellophora europaea (strain CBS 101466) TaxID=1220924 RepID=W2S6R8_CYPE1|nr:uncharacterized protein HMPREF1541_10566 [Cyphellophora europaea CBS 101466]ETN44386.1 hypothetical protein HMPREF1541_10566 [Cyphellophora europaea CBS 101466]
MIIRYLYQSVAATLLAACLILTLLPPGSYAKKDGPTITGKEFEQPLEGLFYFDDSDVILGRDADAGDVWRSPDAGETWHKVEGEGQEGKAWDLWPHPWDKHRAYILGAGEDHWITTDRGETWRKFNSKSSPDIFRASPLNFHGRDAKKVIWNGETCAGFLCEQAAYYTDDDFETVHIMGTMTRGCQWAVGTEQFGKGVEDVNEDRIFCIAEGLYSPWQTDNRLLVSDNYFDGHAGIEVGLDEGRAITGVISMAAVKSYLVAAAKSEGTDELALFVTVDGDHWHRCEFGQHRIEEGAYTILESTNYSMQVDVLGSRPMNPMGYLFTSNSNGTYFTRNIDHTNRNVHGRVDFEKISNIQGIVLVNVVDNFREVEGSTLADKDVKSQISFDDGRTFQDLSIKDDKLHLHSVTDARQGGRVFSSPAPGIVMGVGNTGKHLKPYEKGDLFVSDDAGVSWTKALDGPQLYEFGNQGAVIVAMDDDDETDTLRFSIDHGKNWQKADLGVKVRAKFITTAPDSTTLKFLVMGVKQDGWHIFKVDFEGLHERSCKKDDFEKWPARVDEDGKTSCIMGHKQFYRRRKADADCFIDEEFKDPEPQFEACKCTKADFECDFNFVRSDDRKDCKPAAPISVPEGVCKSKDDTFKASSGWRLIPGNECERDGGESLDKDIERPCDESITKPGMGTGKIGVEKTEFRSQKFAEWYYLEQGGNINSEDESLILRTSDGEIYLTKDHGKTWAPILKHKDITQIVPNPHFFETVYFLTRGKTVHYTFDRGNRFDQFEAPEKPSELDYPKLKFHPDYKDWLLWSGQVDDHTNVFWSEDRGDDWKTLRRYVRSCDFIPKGDDNMSDKKEAEKLKQLVYCEQYEAEDPSKNLQLVSSDDFFRESPEVHFDDILAYATMSEFIIVAAKEEDGNGLKVDASVDGRTFAAARFPKNFQVDLQQAYTVMDSSTHAVFLHVTVNPTHGQEYGSILKSNSNGTSYVLTLNGVNRDTAGFVDFEKMHGLEGVAMVNVVSNIDKVEKGGDKKLKSMITHNDGAQWGYIPPPKARAEGGSYKCVKETNKATEGCSLHLHSYTERSDKSATFSSPSAVGVMLGVGNVGSELLPRDHDTTDTFITRDAGITWKSIKKGSYLFEYGDQGSIIVIVQESTPTRALLYTLDEGDSWNEHIFSEVDMQIDAITTVPSDRSMNFLLWGKEVGSGKNIFTVALDFSALQDRERACDFNEEKPENKDYFLWEPKHPLQSDNCLFGHVAQYHRKRLDAKCHNGKAPLPQLHNIKTNCSCTRSDFECDYNYQLKPDGSCALVPGLDPPDHAQQCAKDPDREEYYYPSGYRRVPLTTCQGGQELDKTVAQPCPGHEDEFNKKHGLSGAGLFFVIIIPIAAACGVGYWVFTKHREGFGSFGQIRLGESMGSGGPGESPWITVPVAVISAVVAVSRAIPMVLTSLWRSAQGFMPLSGGGGGSRGRFGLGGQGPYRSRDAFANRRQDYSQVVEDDELLGDGLDDEEGDV